MERKYTPGKWEPSHDGTLSNIVQFGIEDYDENGNEFMRFFFGLVIYEKNPTKAETVSLIAAAPDLLEALEECLDFMKDIRCDDMAGQDWLDFVQEKARTAIKKATNI
jgi:hypothetical protein